MRAVAAKWRSSSPAATGVGPMLAVATVTQLMAFAFGRRSFFADETGYLSLADGIRHGAFSSWWFLDGAPPDTLRTPGYPLFLVPFRLVSTSTVPIEVAQIAALLGVQWMLLRVLRASISGEHARRAQLVFLVLLAPSLQLAYRCGQVNPDALTAVFVTLWGIGVVMLHPGDRGDATASVPRWSVVVLATGSLGAYLLRPAFIVLIVITFGIGLARARRARPAALRALVAAGIAFAGVVPFGVWSLSAHGSFHVFPLEGGAGQAHLGMWSYRVPVGFQDRYYWTPIFERDPYLAAVARLAYPDERDADAAARYDAEWERIVEELERTRSASDRAMVERMLASGEAQFVVHDTRYTAHRESLLWRAVIDHAKAQPMRYVVTRVAGLPRWWFSGWDESSRTEQYAAVSSLACTAVPLGWLTILVARRGSRQRLPRSVTIWVGSMWLFTIVHSVFLVAARYMLPWHLLVFAGASWAEGTTGGARSIVSGARRRVRGRVADR